MNNGFSIFILALVIVFCFVPAHSQNVQSEVSLTARLIESGKNELKIEFSLENLGESNIYVAANATPVFGKSVCCLLADAADRSLLKVSSRVYDRPPYYPIYDNRNVELKRLNSDEKLTETVVIKFPVNETDPPFYRKERRRRKFNSSEIKKVELTVGYFIEEEGIVEFLKLKPLGWFIKGQEILRSGKHKNRSFLEIQQLTSTLIEKSGPS